MSTNQQIELWRRNKTQSHSLWASLLNHEKIDANSTAAETPASTTTRDHHGINGALKLFSPEAIYALSPCGGQSGVAPSGKLPNAPACFLKGALITSKDVVNSSGI